jgi:transglutaminase-like putative cysteine protease
MKKSIMKMIYLRWWITVIFLVFFIIPITAAQSDLYQKDSLDLDLEIKGKFEVVPIVSNPGLKEVKVEMMIYPEDDFRQSLLSSDLQGGSEEKGKIVYIWKDGSTGSKEFGYQTTVRTNNQRLEVRKKVEFPLKTVSGMDEYLNPTKTIDSDNPQIISQASKLVEGEDDLFRATFNLASWVEENVDYQLTTLTTTTSQKASWVLENKRGVCDEMTSLFVAMCRSVGIPARFVSGVSYSTNENFRDEPWQPHGWAEVYFPEIGWVSFDIAFNQYGYVDVTHIKLRDGFDPQEVATKYEWTSLNKVDIKPSELKVDVEVKKEGADVTEEILLEEEILSSDVGFGSYNLVKGIVKNTADHYVATALHLSVPKEVEIIGRNRRNIILNPKEVRDTYWIVRTSGNLNEDYVYTMPMMIYSEKNVTVKDSFKVFSGQRTYSEEDIEELTVKDEEKSYSRKVKFDCQYPEEVNYGEEAEFSCTIKNVGNTNLEKINFCIEEVCEVVSLPINQEKSNKIKEKGLLIGWNKVTVSAESALIEKKQALNYIVLDPPKVKTKVDSPTEVKYGEKFQIDLHLEKNSFQIPEKVKVYLLEDDFEQEFQIESLTESQQINVLMEDFPLQTENDFKVKTTWQDKKGKNYEEEQKFEMAGKSETFGGKVKMFLNWVGAAIF